MGVATLVERQIEKNKKRLSRASHAGDWVLESHGDRRSEINPLDKLIFPRK